MGSSPIPTRTYNQRGAYASHSARTRPCSWEGCTTLITTKSRGLAYCPAHKLVAHERNRERNCTRQRDRRHRGALPPAPQTNEGSWLVVHDPDGDFTNRRINRLEIAAMLRLHTFSPGTILRREGEEIVVK